MLSASLLDVEAHSLQAGSAHSTPLKQPPADRKPPQATMMTSPTGPCLDTHTGPQYRWERCPHSNSRTTQSATPSTWMSLVPDTCNAAALGSCPREAVFMYTVSLS